MHAPACAESSISHARQVLVCLSPPSLSPAGLPPLRRAAPPPLPPPRAHLARLCCPWRGSQPAPPAPAPPAGGRASVGCVASALAGHPTTALDTSTATPPPPPTQALLDTRCEARRSPCAIADHRPCPPPPAHRVGDGEAKVIHACAAVPVGGTEPQQANTRAAAPSSGENGGPAHSLVRCPLSPS